MSDMLMTDCIREWQYIPFHRLCEEPHPFPCNRYNVGKMSPASSGGGFHIRSQRECKLLLTAVLPSSVLVLIEWRDKPLLKSWQYTLFPCICHCTKVQVKGKWTEKSPLMQASSCIKRDFVYIVRFSWFCFLEKRGSITVWRDSQSHSLYKNCLLYTSPSPRDTR